jgi:Mg2+-importing ATPase
LFVVVLDALTLWTMLGALGLEVHPAPVFASFMLSTLARILSLVPGGLGVFEVASVASLRLMGVPVGAGLAATLLMRGFSFWLPMLPATLFAHREARA